MAVVEKRIEALRHSNLEIEEASTSPTWTRRLQEDTHGKITSG